MFSSNPLPNFPSSSSYSPFPLLIDPENAYAITNTCTSNTLIYDPLPVNVPFMPTQVPISQTLTTNFTLPDNNYTCFLQKEEANDGVYSHFLTKKPAARKDRHSKIYTSQGLRDRRVRLSSEIARKFFDLQEMLEYDKPSNTLEWLFTKSENAIQELARSKPQGVVEEVVHDSNNRSFTQGNLIQSKKESRETARARARARARGRSSSKICSTTSTGRVNDMIMEERFLEDADPQILHQFMPPIHPNYVLGGEVPRERFDITEESIVLKMNLKPSLLANSNQQNLGISKESCFNYNSDYHSCSNSPPNWDTDGVISGSSSFSGIPSMNLSTDLQIFGKFGGECANQR